MLLYGSKRPIVYHHYTGKRPNRTYLCISNVILQVTIIYELNLKWTCSNPRCLNVLILFPLWKYIDKVVLLFSNLRTTAPFSSRLEAQSHLLSFDSNTWSSRHVCWRWSIRRGDEGEAGSDFKKPNITQRHCSAKTCHNIKSSQHNAKTDPLRHHHIHSTLAQGNKLGFTSACVSLPAVSVTCCSLFVANCKWKCIVIIVK